MRTPSPTARAVAACLLLLAAPLRGQITPLEGQPLPDAESFLSAARAHLVATQERENRFAYKERRTELHMNPFGRLGTGGTRVYEVTPAADGSSLQRRLIERDGTPVTGSVVERIERRGRGRFGTRAGLDDVMSVLQLTIDRREMLDGHSTIVVRFSPRRSAKPRTREGRIAQSMEGQIWIREDAREVEKVEARAIEALSFGYGLLARLGEGATLSLVRKPMGDIWIPTAVRLDGAGRAMVVRKLTVNFAVDWFDYRRIGP